ncbi:MAG: 5'-3' exonuclease H3TH domain-containing protein [Patescibacteria group bacterium]
MKTILIIDSHALIHRAYHAIPPLTTKAGIPTNALYGYLNLLYKAIHDIKPTHLVACFDTPTESFRAKLVEEYQATRKPADDALKSQFNLVKEAVDSARIIRYEAPNYEADDAIGTVTCQLDKECKSTGDNYRIIIFTGDKDMFQLVTPNIFVLTPQIGFGKSVLYGPKEVEEKMGVGPEYIADMKALMGDTSDNYKGLKKIGPKTAAKYIKEYGHVEDMEKAFDVETMQILRTMKKVSSIVCDVPGIDSHLNTSEFHGFADSLIDTLKKYELYSLIPRFTKKENKIINKEINKVKTDSTNQDSLF